ncbi:hypothetical protein RKD30_002106 [Streptomyces pristinaespiralis]
MALFKKRTVGKPGEWYYCLQHKKVEEGPECPAKDRFGPYASRVEATQAMETARENGISNGRTTPAGTTGRVARRTTRGRSRERSESAAWCRFPTPPLPEPGCGRTRTALRAVPFEARGPVGVPHAARRRGRRPGYGKGRGGEQARRRRHAPPGVTHPHSPPTAAPPRPRPSPRRT